jgi:hypothetical protein
LSDAEFVKAFAPTRAAYGLPPMKPVLPPPATN